eukprot:1053133-Amphidinium_carterae.1
MSSASSHWSFQHCERVHLNNPKGAVIKALQANMVIARAIGWNVQALLPGHILKDFILSASSGRAALLCRLGAAAQQLNLISPASFRQIQ